MTHRRDETTDAGRQSPRFITVLAEDAETVRAAQRLRYRVFRAANAAEEPRERLSHEPHQRLFEPQRRLSHDAIDEDHFDRHCRHLVVRETTTGAVVGTYRILTAERARAAGGFYSETEFDCSRLRRLDGRLVEVGRACVDPAYRSGGVITLLLGALTRWVVAHRYDYVLGCASIDLADGVDAAASLCRRLVREHLAPEAWRVVPHTPFRLGDRPVPERELPPLIKAYLRFGASVAGEPAFDEAFATADVLMVLPMAAMAPRFRARLLRDDPTSRAGRRTRWAA
jgi:putative hemolysin